MQKNLKTLIFHDKKKVKTCPSLLIFAQTHNTFVLLTQHKFWNRQLNTFTGQ